MVDSSEKVSNRIFIPSLTLGCCLLIVLLISVQFVWHLRYQSLQAELTELQAVNSELLVKQGEVHGIVDDTEQALQQTAPRLGPSEKYKLKEQKSIVEPLTNSYGASDGIGDRETPQAIFREMFEDEYSHLSDSDIHQSGEQILKDAVQGYLSDDPEYRLDAAIALREIRGRAFEPQLASSLLKLADSIDDPALQAEILWTLEGAVNEASLPQLMQHLQHADQKVRHVSAYLLAQGVLSPEHENSLVAQQLKADLVEHIRKNPDQFLEYYTQTVIKNP